MQAVAHDVEEALVGHQHQNPQAGQDDARHEEAVAQRAQDVFPGGQRQAAAADEHPRGHGHGDQHRDQIADPVAFLFHCFSSS